MSDIETIREWFRGYAGGISTCSIPAAEDLLIRLGKKETLK